MTNWISPRQMEILSMLNPELQKEFMKSFMGEEKLPDQSCGEKVSERMLEIVKSHPFWGQKTPDGKKYKFIRNPQKCKPRKYFKTDKMCIEIGGYFMNTSFFTIVCKTGELFSVRNTAYKYFGHKEKFFMMRLDKFQEKYETQFGPVALENQGHLLGDSEPWTFFKDSELMDV